MPSSKGPKRQRYLCRSFLRGISVITCIRSSPVREGDASSAHAGQGNSEPAAGPVAGTMMAACKDCRQPAVQADQHTAACQHFSALCTNDMHAVEAATTATTPEDKVTCTSSNLLTVTVLKHYEALMDAAGYQAALQPYMCPKTGPDVQHLVPEASMPSSSLEASSAPISAASSAPTSSIAAAAAAADGDGDGVGVGDGSSLTDSSASTKPAAIIMDDIEICSDDDRFWDARSQLSANEASGGVPDSSCIISVHFANPVQHGVCQVDQTYSLLRMSMQPHLPQFAATSQVLRAVYGPSKPLPFIGPGASWQPVPVVTGLQGCWLKVPERSSPAPLPIDVMLQANWLARKAHEGIRGVQISEDHKSLTITAKVSLMGVPITHREVYYKDGSVYRGMMRRELKPGYVEHRAFWTSCGKLVLVKVALKEEAHNCWAETIRGQFKHFAQGGELQPGWQARYSYLTEQAAMQHFVGTRSQRL